MGGHTQIQPAMLRSFEDWSKELSPGGFWGVLQIAGGVELAAAFSKLFWPDFIEVGGCVVLAEQYNPQSFDAWRAQFGEDRSRTEEMVNHVHMYDLFPNDSNPDADQGVAAYLASVLIRCWAAALREAFPDRDFEFSLATEPDDYGPTVTFWQREPSQG